MSTIDERIVAMKFNNAQFQKNVGDTIKSLADLAKGTKLEGATKGMDDLAAKAGSLNLGPIGNAVQNIADKFSALSIVGIAALGNLASKAVDVGLSMVKSLTIDPVRAGFDEYELKMGSIQTILANTQKDGTTLDQVTASLDTLNEYADKTIYNFGDMTKNIGLFTNAGIGIEDATSMIKGFSNEAAASGTSSQGAAGAAYQLSQALSAGTIRLMDWRSLTNVGMGNKNMQNGLIEIAEAMGTFEGTTASASSASKDFNGSLEAEWLSADVMSTYLKVMAEDTFDLAKAQALAAGLTDEQATAMANQAVTANEAATKVRTFTGLIGTLRESVGSGWAQTFDYLIGDFNEATELFTGINDRLGPLIGKMGDQRNAALQGWTDGGGRAALVQALSNAFEGLMGVLEPIGRAFEQIFPPTTAETLIKLSNGALKLSEAFLVSAEQGENIRRTFAGVFAVFGIVGTALKTVFGLVGAILKPLLETITGTGAGILGITARLGDWLVAMDTTIKQAGFFQETFDKVSAAIKPVADWLAKAKDVVLQLTSAFSAGGLNGVLKSVQGNLTSFGTDVNAAIAGPLAKFLTWFSETKTTVREFGSEVARIAKMVVESVQSFSGSASEKATAGFTATMEGLKALGGELINGFGNTSKTFGNISKTFGNIGDSAREMYSSVSESLAGIGDWFRKTMNAIDPNLATGTMNMGLFAAGALLIKKMFDPKGALNIVSWATTAKEGLTGVLDGVTGALSGMQAQLKSKAILNIALAIGVLALSLVALTFVDSDKLLPAAIALSAMAGVMIGAMALMEKVATSGGFLKLPVIGLAMLLLGGALIFFSIAASKFAELDWEELARGLVGITATLAATNLAKNGAVDAVALLLLSTAINTIAEAFVRLSKLDWNELAKGGAVMLAMLGFITALSKVKFDGSAIIKAAAAMIILGGAMMVMGIAIQMMAGIDWVTFADGLAKIAVSLGVLVGALNLMPKDTASKSVGILVLSAALLLLSVSLKAFATMSWEDFGKSMAVLAGTMLILVVAMQGMQTALPGAAALITIAFALSILIPALAILGALPINVIGIALVALAATLLIFVGAGYLLAPIVLVLVAFGAAILLIGAGVMAAGAGLMWMGAGLLSIAAGGMAAIPALKALISTFIDAIPALAAALANGLAAFIAAIAAAAPSIIESFVSILIALLDAIDVLVPRLLETAVKLLTGLLGALDIVGPKAIDSMFILIMALVDKLKTNVPKFVDAALQMVEGILQGIAKNLGGIIQAGTDIIVNFLDGIGKAIPRLVQAGIDLILDLVNGLAEGIRNNTDRVNEAGRNLASAIVDGMTSGINNGIKTVTDAAKNLAKNALNAAKGFLGINSPSKEFMKIGQWSSEGMADGITNMSGEVVKASKGVAKSALSTMRDAMASVGDYISTDLDMTPTIRPVVDLSEVQKGVSDIGTLMNTDMGINNAYQSAASISNARRPRQDDLDLPENNSTAGGQTIINFEQHNTSPVALSNVEIYRQTKNQLSQVKEALNIS